MVLAASASYIAVPAVLRHALPEVNPALYMGMSLGITFPFNIILGIPLYTYLAQSISYWRLDFFQVAHSQPSTRCISLSLQLVSTFIFWRYIHVYIN